MKHRVLSSLCALIAGLSASPSDLSGALVLSETFPRLIEHLPRDVMGAQHSIELPGGGQAMTVVFRQTSWELKDMPQSAIMSSRMEQEAMKLNETERLRSMNRIDDHTQVWALPLKQFPQAGLEMKKHLKPTVLSHKQHRELAFLGRSQGMDWYAYMPIYEWVWAQKKLNCNGGEDSLAAATRGLSIEDRGSMTANSVPQILIDAGSQSLPHIQPLLESSNYWNAIRVVDGIKGSEAEKLLLDLAKSERSVARGARRCLEYKYRESALPFYLQWLNQDAGREDVYQLITLLEGPQLEKLRPYLPRVAASPSTFNEYRLAFELSRKIARHPIPERILQIEKDMRKYGYRSGENFDQTKVDLLAQELGRAEDSEAAGVVALSLAIAVTKGNWTPANRAGMAALDLLPEEHGKKVLNRLLTTCRDRFFKERIEYVSKQ